MGYLKKFRQYIVMSRPIIEASQITKCYGEIGQCEIQVLKGVDVEVKKGEFLAIMGPSGSGKTTLLDIVGGLLRPTSGEVMIDGETLSDLTQSEIARVRGKKIGFIFQQYNLIPSLTAAENVELSLRINGKGKDESKKRANSLLNMVGLSHRIMNKPSQLSGGEQQRVAICRALANSPKIILGDEPTGNLDSKNGFMVLGILKKLNKEEGYTIVVVTHDHRIGKYADRIIHMLDGRVHKRKLNNSLKNKKD
jgi:putative ABC transport system ATP-binding protein